MVIDDFIKQVNEEISNATIEELDETYVYLVDGRIRVLENPKRKKRKHVQVICENHDVTNIDDVGIKRILKLFDKEMRRI